MFASETAPRNDKGTYQGSYAGTVSRLHPYVEHLEAKVGLEGPSINVRVCSVPLKRSIKSLRQPAASQIRVD